MKNLLINLALAAKKKKIFTFFLTLVASVGTMFASTKIGNLYYNLDATNQTAKVTYKSCNFSNYTFNEGWDITTANIPSTVTYNDVTYSVTSIGESAFRECSSLTSVTIPNSVTSIGRYAFSSCHGLTSIEIPNSVSSIGNYAFKGSSLTSVTIGNSVTSIGDYAFAYCDLTSVTIPNSVTSIGDLAFYDCSSLTSVTIGNSVTSIGDQAFAVCSGLTSVTSKAITPPSFLGDYVFAIYNIPLYVPKGSVNAYKNADGWNRFNQILPIGGGEEEEQTITTCAEAAAAALSVSADEVLYNNGKEYTVAGYVTEIATAWQSKYSTVSFWMADTQNGGRVLEAFRAVCYNESDAPRVGDYVRVTGKLSKYGTIAEFVEGCTYVIVREGERESAEETETTEVKATPTEEGSVILEWPAVDGAATYAITIFKNGELVCSLTFDAEGHLISIAFSAPARDGNGRNVPAAEQAAKGWRYEVKGLEAGAEYTYTITAKQEDESVLFTQSVDFTMPAPQGIYDINAATKSQKIVRDNQILILRGDKTYTLTGQETIMP